jgi:hypothetical protein
METILPVTVFAGTLAQLGFSAVLPRRVPPASQVDVKAEVAGRLKRFNAAIVRKISLSTAGMASRLERTEASRE